LGRMYASLTPERDVYVTRFACEATSCNDGSTAVRGSVAMMPPGWSACSVVVDPGLDAALDAVFVCGPPQPVMTARMTDSIATARTIYCAPALVISGW
jgi:hypothetical protein